MKYPTIRYVFNRKKTASDTKSAPLEISICYNRKQKYFATGVQLCNNQWDPKTEKVVNIYNCIELNLKIDAFYQQIKNFIMMQMLKGEPFSFDELTAHLSCKKHSGSFREFVSNRIEERKDITESTRKSHRSLVCALEKFKRVKTFDDLTLGKIEAFDTWLHEQGYMQTTIGKYHKFMKTYVHEAIRDGLIEKDPYFNFKVDKGKSRARKYLDEQELSILEKWKPEDPSVERAKDVFIFQCYTGLAYADLAKMDFSKAEKRGGKYVIRDTRKKTEEDFYIVLLSPALAILKKYNCKLPILSNQKYNMALKAVGVKINRSLTSHMGRHTAATMFLNKGMPLEVLAKVLGHTNTNQTQQYAKIVNKTVDNAFAMIEDLLPDIGSAD